MEQSRERKRLQSAHGGNKLLAAAELFSVLSLVSSTSQDNRIKSIHLRCRPLLLFSNSYFVVFSAAGDDG
jgi:hypothetical protein